MLEDEKCLIGSPCSKCEKTCGYYKTLQPCLKGQDEKEKENERIFEGNEE